MKLAPVFRGRHNVAVLPRKDDGSSPGAHRRPTPRPKLFLHAAICLLCASSACASTPSKPASQRANPLFVAPQTYDFTSNPALLARILKSPHGYFRFVNRPFSEAVCRAGMPTIAPRVNLHGDAHVEQYAVTDLGRGLTDFDDATTGPATIDLMRFGVSLMLTTEARGWSAYEDRLLTRFLKGYRRALRVPKTEAPVPAVARRIRDGFKKDRAAYFEGLNAMTQPMPIEERAALQKAFVPYARSMQMQSPELRAEFFDIVQTRRLSLGIGSALDDKFLVRVAGDTDDPLDDVVLEVKEIRDLSGISCINATTSQDPFRVLVGQSRIAYRPHRFLGYIRLERRIFWIHAWVDNYREFKLDRTARTPEELAEVVYDVGIQMGRGHPNQIAAPFDRQLRDALIQMLDGCESDLRTAIKRFTRDLKAAWRRFKSEAKITPKDGRPSPTSLRPLD
ncbi:MAG: DUF2252 family protein [Myxococcota bacterium]